MIKSHPIPTEKVDAFASPELIPFPDSVGSLDEVEVVSGHHKDRHGH